MSVLHFADLKAVPWKNGLGVTREIAAAPEGASMDDFHWRVSIADVDTAAPFSRFPGVDRIIVLLAGPGFTMTLDGEREHALTTPGRPFAFRGEADVGVTLAGGATRDFNLMVRRKHAGGTVEALHVEGAHALAGDTVLVHVIEGSVSVDGQALRRGDTWLGGGTLEAAMPGFVLAVRITAPSPA